MMDLIKDYFVSNRDAEVSIRNIYEVLKLKTHPMRTMCLDVIMDMIDDGYLKEKDGRIQLAHKEKFVEGVIQRRAGGKNYLVPDDGSAAIMVAERNSKGAQNGDRVRIVQFARRSMTAPEGEVLEILQRAKDTFVGTLQVDHRQAFLVTANKNDTDIFIPRDRLKGGHDGDKAVVKVIEWPSEAGRNPVGKVIDLLGAAGENETEMHAILAEYGLPYTYPATVEEAANAIPSEIPASAFEGREDFRDVTTFTIDPRDAKDFDDAISIRKIREGLWEVGVHIADVSYYVTEGGIIDREAYKRATSVYLVDRTVPMLPEKLCNDLCSLRQDEDKLAYSVIFTMDSAAEVRSSRIVRTVIRSNRRFAYEEVQAIIEREKSGEKGPLPGDELVAEIMTLNSMAQTLRDRRMSAGALDFDRVEVHFDVDEKGRPVSVFFKESKEANKLIEEFMLLANRTVAEFIGKTKGRTPKTFVYRVHDKPDQDRLENLAQFVQKFGYKVKTSGTNVEMSKSINKLLADVKGKREQNLVEIVSLRTMQKACYSTENIGHYGLSMDYYTHFTSPIRRYPDLMVHRLLTRYLAGGRSVMQSKYEEYCEHSSNMEQLAEQAERASIKYKQVEYMSERMGQAYDAVISGVTEWGIYAEIIENKCDGLIPIRSLGSDYFEFDEKNYCLTGHATGRKYRLGDPIKVVVSSCNLEKKQMDYALAD
ncbi:MAG: ribonuclease R [Bacteroidaceae bacterium]|nr:ribonuclease R [Bacteroidaceae bacterium]